MIEASELTSLALALIDLIIIYNTLTTSNNKIKQAVYFSIHYTGSYRCFLLGSIILFVLYTFLDNRFKISGPVCTPKYNWWTLED